MGSDVSFWGLVCLAGGRGEGGPFCGGFSRGRGFLDHGKFFSWVWDTSKRVLGRILAVQLGL